MKSIVYIICIIGLLIGAYFYNKKINLNYRNFTINNFNLYLECVAINIFSLFFGKDYFSFSIYLIALIMIYLVYLSKDIRSINDENKRVKETFTYFSTHFVFIVFLNIPVFFISGLMILAYTFFSLVILSVIILLDTLNIIKKKESYKLMTEEEIDSLFPGYDINNLYRAVFNTIYSVKNNYMNNLIDNSKENLSDDLYNLYKQKERDNVSKSQKETFESIAYVSANLIDINDGKFKVELVYSYKNYVIDIATGRVLSGTPQFPKRYTYVIDFEFKDKVIICGEKLIKSI